MVSSCAVMRTKRTRRVAVVLSGCGVYDGSEVQEAVATILALERAGAEVLCAAPNVAMPVVINHLTGQPMIGDERSVLVESARIARGNVRDLASVLTEGLDGAIVPGGYGATRVLCDHARAGRDARVLPVVERFLKELYAAKRPTGYLCLAPVVAARVFGGTRPKLGVGAQGPVSDMEAMGADVQTLSARDIAVDRDHRFVCAAAFTATTRLSDAMEGIERLTRALFELMP